MSMDQYGQEAGSGDDYPMPIEDPTPRNATSSLRYLGAASPTTPSAFRANSNPLSAEAVATPPPLPAKPGRFQKSTNSPGIPVPKSHAGFGSHSSLGPRPQRGHDSPATTIASPSSPATRQSDLPQGKAKDFKVPILSGVLAQDCNPKDGNDTWPRSSSINSEGAFPRSPIDDARRNNNFSSLQNNIEVYRPLEGVAQSNVRAANREESSTAHSSPHLLGYQTPAQQQSKGAILYKLVCSNTNTKVNTPERLERFSWTPFEGIGSDKSEDKARQELSVIDVVDQIAGPALRERQTQQRHKFGTVDDIDPAPFRVGVDILSRYLFPTSIRILSPSLLQILRSLILYYPTFDLQMKEIIVTEPFKEIFYYWKELHLVHSGFVAGKESVTIKNEETGSEVVFMNNNLGLFRDDLHVLLTAPPVIKVYTSIIEPEFNLYDQGAATYNNLWLLFRPGDIVLARVRGKLAGFVVERVEHFSEKRSTAPDINPQSIDKWKLSLWNLSYKNGKLIRQSYPFNINRFNGEKPITELPVFPIARIQDKDTMKQDLIQRGKRYHKIICNEQCHMQYNGMVISEQPYYYDGKIIVDHRNYMLDRPNSIHFSPTMPDLVGQEPQDVRGEPLFSKFNDMECLPDNPLEPAQYMLLPGHVLGFALGKKEWAIFDMSSVTEIEEELDPMQPLIIDKESRELLLAAAGSPLSTTALKPWTSEWTSDFIEGKGRGKVLFLHGSPGTGKTMTVECLSKYTGRPLISLSAADLGTEEVSMEKRLVKWLDRAAMWGAIVLIDEAEVYLEQRRSGDLTRNALVTAFLRTMEYFPGLLFLTSNGIGLFDEAVISRIHLSIFYARPTLTQLKDIWNNLIHKLGQDQLKEKNARQETERLIKEANDQQKELQIRNPQAVSRTLSQPRPLEPRKPEISVEPGAGSILFHETEAEYANLILNGRDMRNTLLSSISVATRSPIVGKDRITRIIVKKEHLRTVLNNKSAFRDAFKKATDFFPEDLAANNNLRGK